MGIGLALSGGGSRAAAFHRGTLKGLEEVGLLQDVDSLSTVSGGSVLGGAWMKAIADGKSLAVFLDEMEFQLANGFVGRSIKTPNALRLLRPGYHLTDLFAETFDKVIFHGMTLGELPTRPALCLNTTVLNTGQIGKFTREGFRTSGRFLPHKRAISLQPIIMPRFLLARAVTASAAFPLGLCILALRRGHEIPGSWGKGTEAENIARLDLTDGGVLENLGVQTLLTTKGLARWDLVISDAGTAENSWNPSFQETFKSWFMGHLSRGTLKAVSTLMNNRCDRHMRHEAMLELESSWLAQGMKDRGIVSSAAFAELLREMFPEALFPMPFPFRRRKLLMVRVDQNWKDLLLSIPNWRLVELGGNSVQIQTWRNASDRTTQIELFLESAGRSVAAARDIYNDPRQLGGDAGADTANRVTTHFTSLKDGEIVALFHHARWQIQALKAIYW